MKQTRVLLMLSQFHVPCNALSSPSSQIPKGWWSRSLPCWYRHSSTGLGVYCVLPTLLLEAGQLCSETSLRPRVTNCPCFKCVEERNSRGRRRLSLNRNRHGVGKGPGSVEISVALWEPQRNGDQSDRVHKTKTSQAIKPLRKQLPLSLVPKADRDSQNCAALSIERTINQRPQTLNSQLSRWLDGPTFLNSLCVADRKVSPSESPNMMNVVSHMQPCFSCCYAWEAI